MNVERETVYCHCCNGEGWHGEQLGYDAPCGTCDESGYIGVDEAQVTCDQGE